MRTRCAGTSGLPPPDCSIRIGLFRLDPRRICSAMFLLPEGRARFQIVHEKLRRFERGCTASACDGNKDDALARREAPDPVYHGHAENRPACLRLLYMPRDLALRHARIMFERERVEPVIAAHQPCEGNNGANIRPAGHKPFTFRPTVEIGGLDAYRFHPPVTGGKKASSSSSRRGASKRTCSWLSAARNRSGSAN